MHTCHGPVQGIRIGPGDTALNLFKAVPYAAPPVGPLRWRAPEPPVAWQGIRPAMDFGPDCPQQSPPADSRASSMSEDCLYLNVWAPADAPASPLPVMAWLHGGSFVSGSGSQSEFDGAALVGKGAVVVTINYRLGILGFLAHPGLSRESDHGSSGNYGLLDQIAALRWIQSNIAGFGGDPHRVTVFGVSAGAASIALLLASPLSESLFHRAILQSPGSGRPLASLQEAEEAGARLHPDIDALRGLTTIQVLNLTAELAPGVRSLTRPRLLRPIMDGHVITKDERMALKQGRLRRMPIIVGGNADEGSALTRNWPLNTRSQYHRMVNDNFPSAAREALALYPAHNDEQAKRRIAEMFADTQFNYGIRLLSEAAAQCGAPVWRYQFFRRPRGQTDGPHHGAEVAYVFGTLEDGVHDETDRALSRTMMAAWVAFATTGNPNGAKRCGWPTYAPRLDNFLALDDNFYIGHDWRRRQLDFIDAFYERQDISTQGGES